jgi:hypothetical protein
VPDVPGGGTVRFVNPTEHDYIADVEAREEGGTPAIVDSIRAGLVFQLKEAVGTEEIRRREHSFVRRAIESWDANPAIEILGNHDSERLSIVSFVVRHDDRYLHHNLVVAVLNDLFGIQARGGCSCAGPYGHRLLGIDLDQSHEFEREVDRGCEGIKPGWTRVNVNYFIDEPTFSYLLEAVHLLATDGWRLLPLYRFEPDTGLWRHRDGPVDPPRSLGDITYTGGTVDWPHPDTSSTAASFDTYLDEARALLGAGVDRPPPLPAPEVTTDFEHLRWFWFPDEVPAS